jgi:type II secretory pathway component PulF
MTTYLYNALDKSGGKVSGNIEAETQQEVITKLQELNYFPVDIKKAPEKNENTLSFNNSVSLKDLEFLTSELSLLLESGVKIDSGIYIIKKSKAKPSLVKLLNEISPDLKKGVSLSDAFKKHDKIFDSLYCNLIELGEASGPLVSVFKDLSVDLAFKKNLQSKIISSLAYPTVIFFVCILSVFFIFNFIIPKMSGMFDGVQNLPWYTDVMLSLSRWMIEYQWMLLLGIVVFGAAFAYLLKQPEIQLKWQAFAVKLPVIGTAITTIERIRFNSGLSMMVKSGVQLSKAIELSAGNIKNQVLQHEINIAKTKIKQGSALTTAFQQTSLYPDFFISLLEVGEESGNLSKVCDEIAKRSRQEFESWTERMTTLLEPLMILFMGGFVGGVVVMMLLSMVSINELGM